MSGDDWQLKPAADLGLTHDQRVRSLRRDPSVFSGATRLAWWTAVGAVMRLRHDFLVVHPERLPQKAPYVLVANHSSHIDVVSLMLALPKRLRDRTFPLAAADHFFGELPLATFTAFALNALPMPRQGGGQGLEAMRVLRERLRDDPCGLVLFPEGTRSRNGEMGRFRSGIGLLVAGTDVPVIPCKIDGAFEAFPPDVKVPRPHPVRVIVGEAMTFADVGQDKEGGEKVAQALENAVRALR